MQKLKAEGQPCCRLCPDLGWLPLLRNSGRGWDRRWAAQTERSQLGRRLPRGPCLTAARVEGINIPPPPPQHFSGARLRARTWGHTRSLCEAHTACQALGWALGSALCQLILRRRQYYTIPRFLNKETRLRKLRDLPEVTQLASGRAGTRIQVRILTYTPFVFSLHPHTVLPSRRGSQRGKTRH